VLPVQLHELLDARLHGIELRLQRLRQVVRESAQRVMRAARLRGRADDPLHVRIRGVDDCGSFNLRDTESMASDAIDERGQLLADARWIDVSGICLHRRTHASAHDLDCGRRHLIGGSEPLQRS
jgi:hypothetical protein